MRAGCRRRAQPLEQGHQASRQRSPMTCHVPPKGRSRLPSQSELWIIRSPLGTPSWPSQGFPHLRTCGFEAKSALIHGSGLLPKGVFGSELRVVRFFADSTWQGRSFWTLHTDGQFQWDWAVPRVIRISLGTGSPLVHESPGLPRIESGAFAHLNFGQRETDGRSDDVHLASGYTIHLA